MAILRFATNVPQQVHLHNLEGRLVDSQFGGQQHMFMAVEGAFYVSDKVGQILLDQFRKLNVKPGDPVEITKAEVTNGHGRQNPVDRDRGRLRSRRADQRHSGGCPSRTCERTRAEAHCGRRSTQAGAGRLAAAGMGAASHPSDVRSGGLLRGNPAPCLAA